MIMLYGYILFNMARRYVLADSVELERITNTVHYKVQVAVLLTVFTFMTGRAIW